MGTTEQHAEWLEAVLEDPEIEHARPPDHAHGHDHGHGIDSVWIEVPEVVDLEELEDQLATLPASYVRLKGIVRTGAGWAVVHRVGLRVSSEPFDGAAADERGRLVALGTELSREALRARVAAAVTSA